MTTVYKYVCCYLEALYPFAAWWNALDAEGLPPHSEVSATPLVHGVEDGGVQGTGKSVALEEFACNEMQ